MSLRFLFACIALSLSFSSIACSGSGGKATSGVDEASKLTEIDATEKAALCDWRAEQYGGYGKEKSCGNSKSASDSDQEACIASMKFNTSCTATVGDYQKVVKAYATCGGDQASAQAAVRIFSCASLTPSM